MKELWITLPVLSPDYSGVCSAMFDLGGISVIHDAGGCTGNYTGYDEPRWYGSSSKVFCSALTDIDAVLGRDDKLIDNVIKAGNIMNPTIYTVIGSPVPMVIGSDMEGIAHELETRTGVPSFGFDMNGLCLYDKGVSQAMNALINRFAQTKESVVDRGVNIVGTTPIDFSANSNADDMIDMLQKKGFHVMARMMMGATIEQIEDAPNASVNLVVSQSGLLTAKLMQEKFGIPYVVGTIMGNDEDVFEALEATLEDGRNRIICDAAKDNGVLIIGEQVISNSLRRLLLNKKPQMPVRVASLSGFNKEIAGEGDMALINEEMLIELLKSGRYNTVIADPLIEDLLPLQRSIRFIKFPHVALSSKIYLKDIPRYIGGEMEELLQELIS